MSLFTSSVEEHLELSHSAPPASSVAKVTAKIGTYVTKTGSTIDFSRVERADSENLLVLMPWAITKRNPSSPHKIFTRMTWSDDFDDAHVIAITDPAREATPSLAGAWFIDPHRDTIREIAAFITDEANRLNVHLSNVCVYGSSLGGFGAIGVCSYLLGALAIAEVPQIEVDNWLPGAIKAIERELIGETIQDYKAKRPEQVSLLSRIKAAGTVPAFTLITNTGDACFKDQLDFMRDVKEIEVDHLGSQSLLLINDLTGHAALARADAVPLVKTLWNWHKEGFADN